MSGSTFKRCQHGKDCPDLKKKKKHGSWFYAIRIDTTAGRRLVRRGGFELEREADAQLKQVTELVGLAAGDDDTRRQIGDMISDRTRRGGQMPDADTVRRRLALGADPGSPGVTVGEWMETWLRGRRKIRESVARSYRSHIDLWITPHLGPIPLERLRAPHIDGLFEAIERINAEIIEQRAAGQAWIHPEGDVRKAPKVIGVASQHRIFATLRASLNAAVKQRQIQFNPCAGVELEPETRTEQPRWTSDEARRFLAASADDPLHLLFRIAVLRGLRRGELVGVRWDDADLDAGVLTLRHTILELGGRLAASTPKTEGSERRIYLDAATAEMLRQHRKAQLAARLRAGAAWEAGNPDFARDLIFAREDGSPWKPDYVYRRFKVIGRKAGLPVLTVHQGGRHTGNSLMRDAGVDETVRMREVGHVTKTVSDRYTHTLAEQHREGAEATARLVDGAGS